MNQVFFKQNNLIQCGTCIPSFHGNHYDASSIQQIYLQELQMKIEPSLTTYPLLYLCPPNHYCNENGECISMKKHPLYKQMNSNCDCDTIHSGLSCIQGICQIANDKITEYYSENPNALFLLIICITFTFLFLTHKITSTIRKII